MSLQHPRAFTIAVVWTLGLLYLGSVVHATESSLACPDWPTCFGTMVPEMTGGVFWEHLHRLVAGGLLLLWGLGTWFAFREPTVRPWIARASLAGVGLLLVQSVFGGLTVIFGLPDLISTTHLGLAFAFLILATVLASTTSWSETSTTPAPGARGARAWAVGATATVFVQSIIGGLVRHADAGMACPDVPLCLGQVVPPLEVGLVALHFAHRVLGLVAAVTVVVFAVRARNAAPDSSLRSIGTAAVIVVVLQVGLGFLSVLTGLAVVPVSLHTLVAASLLVLLTHGAVLAHVAARSPASTQEPAGAL